jgi:hypothetical protein
MPIVMCNMPALLLRKKCKAYPEGRTSYRFKKELRDKITIIGKTAFKDPNAPVTFGEDNLPETADKEFVKQAPQAHSLSGAAMQGPAKTNGKGKGKKSQGGAVKGTGATLMNHDFLNNLW